MFSSHYYDSSSVWKGLQVITGCKTKSPHSMEDLRLANDLNDFYCRFDRQWTSPNPVPTTAITSTTLDPNPPA